MQPYNNSNPFSFLYSPFNGTPSPYPVNTYSGPVPSLNVQLPQQIPTQLADQSQSVLPQQFSNSPITLNSSETSSKWVILKLKFSSFIDLITSYNFDGLPKLKSFPNELKKIGKTLGIKNWNELFEYIHGVLNFPPPTSIYSKEPKVIIDGFEFKITHVSKKINSYTSYSYDCIFDSVYRAFLIECFQNENHRLFELMVESHKQLNKSFVLGAELVSRPPKSIRQVHFQLELDIISLAFIFNKSHMVLNRYPSFQTKKPEFKITCIDKTGEKTNFFDRNFYDSGKIVFETSSDEKDFILKLVHELIGKCNYQTTATASFRYLFDDKTKFAFDAIISCICRFLKNAMGVGLRYYDLTNEDCNLFHSFKQQPTQIFNQNQPRLLQAPVSTNDNAENSPVVQNQNSAINVNTSFADWYRNPVYQKIFIELHSQIFNHLKKVWLASPKIRALLVNKLIESKGVWEFNLSETEKKELFDPLVSFLIEQPRHKRKVSLVSISFIIGKFRFRGEKSGETFKLPELAAEPNIARDDVMKLLFSLCFDPLTLGKNLSDRCSKEVAESLFQVKILEIMLFCKHFDYYSKIPSKEERVIPCYLLAQDCENVHAEMMMAHFDNLGILQGLTSDFYGKAQNFLKIKTGLDQVISEESATLSLSQMQQLRECVANAKGNPPILILERKKMSKVEGIAEINTRPIEVTSDSEEEISGFVDKKNGKKKRAREEILQNRQSLLSPITKLLEKPEKKSKQDKHDISSKSGPKKRKEMSENSGAFLDLTDVPLTKKPRFLPNGMDVIEEEALLSLTPSTKLDQENIIEDLAPEMLWQQICLSSIDSVQFVVASSKAHKEALFNNKPLDYPILKSINELKEQEKKEYQICNSSLMGYQIEEIQKQLQSQYMDLSRLLAFPMGLGKTRVFLEMIAHWIAERNGVNLLVVPYSLLEPTLEACLNYFSTVRTEALLTQGNRLTSQYIAEAVLEALKEKNCDELALLLKAFSLIKSEKLYDVLFDKGVYNKEYLNIWNGLAGILQKHLSSLHQSYSRDPEKYGEIVKRVALVLAEARNARFRISQECQENWCTDLDFNDNSIRQWLSEACTKPFFPGFGVVRTLVEVKGFYYPVLHAQCMLVSALLGIGSEINEGLKRYTGEERERLIDFSPKKIQICNKPENLKALLNNGKKERAIVITTYGTASKVELSDFKDTLSSITLDEAQKAHTADSNSFKWLSKLTSEIKSEGKNTAAITLVTGTPFENNFTEMWNLLALANPKGFPETTHNALLKLADKTVESLIDAVTKSNNTNVYELAKLRMFQSFAQFEVFRKEIVHPLVCRARMDDPNILRDWNNRIPVRQDKIIEAKLSQKAAEALNKVHELYQKKQIDQFTYEHTIKRLLLSPDLRGGSFQANDPGIQSILQLFKGKNDQAKTDFILNSPSLNALLNSSTFEKFIVSKEKGLIFTEHVAAATILKESIAHKFGKNAPEIKIFEGALTKEKRQELILWFKEKSDNQRVLILMQEAGGVGLNLPEALKVFKMTMNWNPSTDSQAIHRAIRVGNEGVRKIISIAYGIFFDHHCQAVQDEKLAWEEFFWNKQTQLINSFEKWCILQLACCFHTYLNNKKDKQLAEELKNAVSQIIRNIFNETEEQSLLEAVQAVTPIVQVKVNGKMPELGPVITEVKPMEIIAPKTNKTTLNTKEWLILPLPLCGQETTQVQNSYDNAIKLGHYCLQYKKSDLLQTVTGIFRKGTIPRDAIRNGSLKDMTLFPDKTRDQQILLCFLEEITNVCSKDEAKMISAKYCIKIFEFDNKENQYHLVKKINESQEEMISLYRRRVPLSENKYYYHFEVLHALKEQRL